MPELDATTPENRYFILEQHQPARSGLSRRARLLLHADRCRAAELDQRRHLRQHDCRLYTHSGPSLRAGPGRLWHRSELRRRTLAFRRRADRAERRRRRLLRANDAARTRQTPHHMTRRTRGGQAANSDEMAKHAAKSQAPGRMRRASSAGSRGMGCHAHSLSPAARQQSIMA